MARKPPLSKAELEIARVLWRLEEATPREVFEAYDNKRNVGFQAIQTLLLRLEEKGYIRCRREGARKKFYRPRVRPGTVIRETVDDFLDRLFDGETLPLMRHLIRDRGISDEEIRAVQQWLDELEAQRDEGPER